MSSELLGSAENALKGNLGGAWDILSGYADAYTDLGIGKKFGGAAAAYSLRDVGAMNGPVVRVRRDSDNAEQDFSALAVPYIPEWCNRQVIKPLDVRELNSGGSGNRDGNFVIAQAAYSLRSLGDRQATVVTDGDTAGDTDGKYVVQVRRNVDGTIKSFTADEVSDGTLVSFVNESFTSSLPLDVQGSAAAAYSLRNLSSTYSGPVVNVRRSSDDTTRDFTADSITNGDLVSFVNENQVHYASDYSSGLDSWALVTSSWTGSASWSHNATNDNRLAVTAAATPSGGKRPAISLTTPSNILRGQQYSLELDYEVISGTPVLLGNNFNGADYSHNETLSGSGTATIAANTFAESTNTAFIYFDGENHTFELSIKAIRFKSTVANGFVTTWYDQSGNSNNATQGTAGSQPKIVSNGSLLADGIDFDGTDDELETAASISGSNISGFVVANLDGTAANSLYSIGNTKPNVLFGNPSLAYSLNGGAALSGGTAPTNTDTLFTQLFISGGTSKTFIDGSAIASGDAGSNTASSDKLTIGNLESGDRFMNGSIKELIIYASDQTEKLRSIEESVSGNYSGITLASFSRDGMVRTWYDQSVTDQAGTSPTERHAVQATAANQPTIVSNGSLVADQGIDFDNANDNFLVTSGLSGLTGTISLFSASVRDATGHTISLSNSSSGSRYLAIQELSSQSQTVPRNATTGVNAAVSVSGSTRLTFGLTTGATSTSVGSLGGAVSTTTDDYGDDFSGTNINQIAIGVLRTVSPTGHFNGRIRELLVYDSDQTDNRGAFEANIAEHYGISGIPAEDNQVNGFVETWYDQSGNNRPLIQTTAANQPLIVESGVFLNGVKANEATSNTDMMNLRVSTDGTSKNFGTDDWASGASSKLGLIYVGTVLQSVNPSNDAIVWGGGRGVNSYQEGGVSLQVIKAGTDSWKLMNEREGLSPEQMSVARNLNTDADVIWYGTANNRDFTVNVNGSENTDTESADLDVREDTALSLFGAFGATGGSYYQRSSKGVCKECFLYAGDNITNVPAIATKINEHYSIY